ncbi:peptidoglycan-binding protein [Phenylobacterium sp.]|uniref:peptidoglycan-binding protein n=1 Tax=Phenylobacterium sp. TaxID=1871053 RepID=UPI0025E213EC|nr:peptidoglycan-binding protein [Phenylobacterium sp.]
MPEDVTSEEHFMPRPVRAAIEAPKPFMSSPTFNARPDELGRIAFALDRLTDRIEASETRTGLAISGVEHSVRHAMARIETAEREHLAVATRFDAAAEQLAAEQARASERMRRVETELSGPRSAEAIKLLEEQVSRVVGQVAAADETTRATLSDLEARLAAAPEGADPAVVIEEAVSRLAQRLADAEGRTGEALDALRDSLVQLDQRMYAADGSVRGDMDHRLVSLADDLTRRVEDARTEIAERLAAAGTGQVEARLGEMAEQMAAAEARSAHAIETMGREVLTMAETLNRRVQSAEQRSAEAIEQVGGEIARIAGAVENRLGRTDQLHAEALERLGAEIGKITERLTDRIIQSERRAAQAIDDVGEQVAKVTERIEQRHERAASDLAERIRQSEERTARLLESAGSRLAEAPPMSATPVELQTAAARPDEAASDLPAAPAVFGAELFSRAEPVSQPALDPSNPAFSEEDFAHVDAFASVDGFAPIAEQAADAEAGAEGEAEALPEREPGPILGSIEFDEPAVESAAPQLSTREVIEQARATARAAAAAPRPKLLRADRRRPMRAGGLLGALKARPASTWQTALMVAGGAAFLSVGAAGVVLMEGPTAGHAAHDALPFIGTPRAAVALTPDPAPPLVTAGDAQVLPVAPHAPAPATAAAAPADAAGADYVKVAAAVEQRQPGALAKLKGLADGGHAPSQMFLARLYETGQAGVTQNLAEARRWTLRAAEAGDPTAMHNLALYYFRGEGGPQDTAAAAQWFTKAAQHGVVDSQYNLGLLYQSGSGVPRDLAQAYKWFSIAANSGDSQARTSALDLEGKLPSPQLAQAEAQASAFEPAGLAPTAANSASGPSVVAAQTILGRLGYYKGKPDGANSRDLKLAVSAYQRDQGLAATGALDPATVSRLSVFSR